MKLKGETVIRFGEEGATVSTASKLIYRRLIKTGYKPATEDEDHAVFEISVEDIRLPKPKRHLSEARLAQLAESIKRARVSRKD